MQHQYYLKILGWQELGSSQNKPNRGRYILISKSDPVLTFFPPLSEVILNDSCLIPIIKLFSKDNNKIYCNFVYHNDSKLNIGTRNEYRLYSNISLEKMLFQPNDIIIFRKELIQFKEQEEWIYFIDLVQDTKNDFYKKCYSIIDSYKINMRAKNHAIYTGELREIEDKIEAFIQHGYWHNIIIDNKLIKQINNSEEQIKAKLFNPSSFRDFVICGYQNLCAVTRTVIQYNSYNNLEAAHIKPKSHGGLFLPNNGVALSRDIHWAFDKGFFTFDDNLHIQVHPDTESEYLHNFNNQPIFQPSDPFFRPALHNVEYHRKNVYGLFLHTGRL